MLMKHKKNESINESKDEYYKYSNFMDMISPIASEASRNKNVQKLFAFWWAQQWNMFIQRQKYFKYSLCACSLYYNIKLNI